MKRKQPKFALSMKEIFKYSSEMNTKLPLKSLFIWQRLFDSCVQTNFVMKTFSESSHSVVVSVL